MNIIQEYLVGESKLSLRISQAGKSEVTYDGRTYTRLSELTEGCPCLTKEAVIFAECSNFLATGLAFVVVHDPDEFRERLEDRVNREKDNPKDFLQRSIDFGEYDLSSISIPEVEDDVLRFWVQQQNTGVPFVVECRISGNTVDYNPIPSA